MAFGEGLLPVAPAGPTAPPRGSLSRARNYCWLWIHWYLLQGFQSLWVDFPDVIGLCDCIEVLSTLHDVNQAVVREIRDDMGKVGESSVEESRSIANRWLCLSS